MIWRDIRHIVNDSGRISNIKYITCTFSKIIVIQTILAILVSFYYVSEDEAYHYGMVLGYTFINIPYVIILALKSEEVRKKMKENASNGLNTKDPDPIAELNKN
jgi:hypothetical protein